MASARLWQYRVTWRRIGEEDTFQHRVTAAGQEDARQVSRAEIKLALGPNFDLWRVDNVTEVGPASVEIGLGYPHVL